ncbi:glutamate-cysteine ligase family protein [Dactylosporangium sp. NPDC049525]|uniref:glutamate-cysteine ligase family protein n=1 Tax=Dactylosporangium sp. NPDC049525 TaxID=3154730 RepID=UPI00341504E7
MNDTTSAILTEATAAAYVAAAGFRVGPVGRVGVELEYCVRDLSKPMHRPEPERLLGLLAHLGNPLPGGSGVTIEPGGQLELSSAVGASMADCVAALARDLALVRAVLANHGMVLDGTGLDDVRAPLLVTEHPRYVALAEYHDRSGPKGLEVMCNSASIQVCLDAGSDDDTDWDGYKRRWWLADAIGPVVMAAFANSPHRSKSGRRWVSHRQGLRFGTDASRTRAPRRDDDPRAAWSRYALAAKVAMVAGPDRWHVPAGLTMRAWLRGHGPRPVTLEDLERHLGTLVPPVRPRGYLELRMIDQQPGDGWVVPVAVVTALLDDPQGAEVAAAATEPLRSPLRRHRDWVGAAREGLADPALAAAALQCFTVAGEVLRRQGAPLTVRDAVAEFTDRYVARGSCPAEDRREQRRKVRVGAGG